MRSVDIPIFFKIGQGLLSNPLRIIDEFNLHFHKSVVVYGEKPLDKIANRIIKSLGAIESLKVVNNSIEDVERIEDVIHKQNPDVIVGVGGGKTIDPVKLAAGNTQLGFISIPTILSHDGIASPIAVIRYGNQKKSVTTRMPIGVIVDLDVVRKAPQGSIGAGIGDLLSNISAAADWSLAEDYNKERVDPFALVLAQLPALNFLKTDYKDLNDKRLLQDLAEGLILSGTAMGIAGSSRPSSGAEHLISHALDRITDGQNSHGEQVGIATLFSLCLHNLDYWQRIKSLYEKLNIARDPKDLGIKKEIFLRAVQMAPSIRRRFTILDIKGNDKKLLSRVYDEVYTKD